MVFPGVDLLFDPADPWHVGPYDDKKILRIKPHPFIFINDLDMGQALRVGAYLVHTFDNQNTPVTQDALRFGACTKVHIRHSRMVLRRAPVLFILIALVSVGVGISKGVVGPRSRLLAVLAPVKAFHIRGVENDTV